MSRAAPADRSFYVGYRPLPKRHASTLWAAVPTLVMLMAVVAGAIAAAQRDAGRGRWDSATLREWEGTLTLSPYPILIEESSGAALLLVEMGKRGPRGEVHDAAGRHVRLEGWRLEREGRRMIELAPEPGALTVLGAAPAEPRAELLGAEVVTFRGEILDSKCFLGAMKPGDGKAHKACATLCIDGGVPPMLFGRDERGVARFVLLAGEGMTSAAEIVRPFIGEPVTVRGRAGRLADMDILVVDERSVRRGR